MYLSPSPSRHVSVTSNTVGRGTQQSARDSGAAGIEGGVLGEGGALMRGQVLTRGVLVNGSSPVELGRGHPVRTGDLRWGDAQEKGSSGGGRGFPVERGPSEGTLRKWHDDERKPSRGRFGGWKVSDGVGSGVRTSGNHSCLLSSRLTASPWAAGPRMDF